MFVWRHGEGLGRERRDNEFTDKKNKKKKKQSRYWMMTYEKGNDQWLLVMSKVGKAK